jgi:hypothetical protein
VAELADALDSKSSDRKIVWVRAPPPAVPSKLGFYEGKLIKNCKKLISHGRAHKRTDLPFNRQLFVNMREIAAVTLQKRAIAATATVVTRPIAASLYYLGYCRVESKRGIISPRMKYWEIIADKSQQSRLDLGLCLSRGFSRANSASSARPIMHAAMGTGLHHAHKLKSEPAPALHSSSREIAGQVFIVTKASTIKKSTHPDWGARLGQECHLTVLLVPRDLNLVSVLIRNGAIVLKAAQTLYRFPPPGPHQLAGRNQISLRIHGRARRPESLSESQVP